MESSSAINTQGFTAVQKNEYLVNFELTSDNDDSDSIMDDQFAIFRQIDRANLPISIDMNSDEDSDISDTDSDSNQEKIKNTTEDNKYKKSEYSSDESSNNTDVNLQNNKTEEKWEHTLKDIQNFPYIGETGGITIDMNENYTPIDIFDKLWSEELMHIIVFSTNSYGENLSVQKQEKKSQPTTSEEMKKFLGLCLLQGHIQCHSMRKLFSYDPLYYHPVFPRTMSGVRFDALLRSLTIECNLELYKNDILKNIRYFLNVLVKNFQNIYAAPKELSIDKTLSVNKGRVKCYYKNEKKDKRGIRFYELCTQDGYVLNVEIQKGLNTIENETRKTEKLLNLLKPYLDKGHHIFTDNQFSSTHLGQLLLHRKTYLTTTIKTTKNLPVELTSKKLKHNQNFWRRKNEIYVTKYHDTKDIVYMTTFCQPKTIETTNCFGRIIQKPQVVIDYNKYMLKSERSRTKQMILYNSCPGNKLRWYKKVIFHLLDVTVWNCYCLYKKCTGLNVKYCNFRDTLIKQLLGIDMNNRSRYTLNTKDAQPELGECSKQHYLEKIPVPLNCKRKALFRRCKQCYNNGKRKETSWMCKNCKKNPALCPGACFEEWHSGFRR